MIVVAGMGRWAGLALLVIAQLLAAGARAEDSKTRVAILASVVVPSGVDPEFTSVAAADAAARAAAYALGVEIVSRAELSGTFDDDVRNCGADVRCISARLQTAGADLGVTVVANFATVPPLLTERIVDSRKQAVLAAGAGELSDRAKTLAEQIETHMLSVLREAGLIIGGRVALEVWPPDATVRLRPIAGGADLSAQGPLAAGEYQVLAQRDGYLESATQVQIRPGQETRVMLRLQEAESVAGSPWLWIALGAAGLLAGGVAIAIVSSSDRVQICQARDPAKCPMP